MLNDLRSQPKTIIAITEPDMDSVEDMAAAVDEKRQFVVDVRKQDRPGALAAHRRETAGGGLALPAACHDEHRTAGGQIDLHGIAKRLGEKQDALAIERKVGALAEPGQPPDMRRQILVGRDRSGGRRGWGLLTGRDQRRAQDAERHAREEADNGDGAHAKV